MPDEIIALNLNREDIGQMIDGLSVRRDSWRETQKYLEGQEVDCAIEECILFTIEFSCFQAA